MNKEKLSLEGLIFEATKINIDGNVLTITLNRPERKNALNAVMTNEINYALAYAKQERSIRVVVLAAEGDIFCAGADLKERSDLSVNETEKLVSKIGECFIKLESLPFITISAIKGASLGGGLELALCCDFRVAEDSAILSLPESSLGIIPGAGGTQRLPRLIYLQLQFHRFLRNHRLQH